MFLLKFDQNVRQDFHPDAPPPPRYCESESRGKDNEKQQDGPQDVKVSAEAAKLDVIVKQSSLLSETINAACLVPSLYLFLFMLSASLPMRLALTVMPTYFMHRYDVLHRAATDVDVRRVSAQDQLTKATASTVALRSDLAVLRRNHAQETFQLRSERSNVSKFNTRATSRASRVAIRLSTAKQMLLSALRPRKTLRLCDSDANAARKKP